MKIAIIGAGAMGSLFGVRLALSGEDVWLFDVWQEHIRTIRERGLTIVAPGGDITAYPKATDDIAEIGPADLIIVFVKSTATADAAESALKLIHPETTVLTLQNGYGNAEKLAAVLGPEKIVAGTTAQGATMLEAGRVMHGGSGDTHIGEFTGGITDRLHKVAAVLTKAGLNTLVDGNVASLIWGKLIVNVGINAITALTGLTNGQIADYEETLELARMAVAEAAATAAAAGVALPYPDPMEKIIAVAKATAQNRSSMLQDLSKGRRTEIDAINGAIVAEGLKHGIDTPVNKALTLLVKIRELYNGG